MAAAFNAVVPATIRVRGCSVWTGKDVVDEDRMFGYVTVCTKIIPQRHFSRERSLRRVVCAGIWCSWLMVRLHLVLGVRKLEREEPRRVFTSNHWGGVPP